MPKFLKKSKASHSIGLAERLNRIGKDNKLIDTAAKKILEAKNLPKEMLVETFNKEYVKRQVRFNTLFQNIENDCLTKGDCVFLKKKFKLLIKKNLMVEEKEGEFDALFVALKENNFTPEQKVFLKQIIPVFKEMISKEIERETKRFNVSKEQIIGGINNG